MATTFRLAIGMVLPFIGLLSAGHSLANIGEQAQTRSEPVFLRPAQICPSDPEILVAALLRDLPSYANRVASRSRGLLSEQSGSFSTVLIAGAPDFEPLDLSEQAFGAGLDRSSEMRQIFFTTLERQYSNHQAVSLQTFHWLFLVRSEDSWRLALIYSSVGAYPVEHRAPTPPQESSDGIIGQAVRLWLRDCRAGTIFAPEPIGE